MVWEQRWHPLREEWVIVAAHRNDRPWTGQTAAARAEAVPDYVADCPLCPGNVRVSGRQNPPYTDIFVFDNDLPCVGPQAPDDIEPAPGIYRHRPAKGMARVVCYSPRHDVTLAELEVQQIADLLREKGAEEVLGERPDAAVPGLDHARALATRGGIFDADVVLIPLEDGDRCEALVAMGKKVIAIDLNPLSRTARKATVSIVDNIVRAVPLLTEQVRMLSSAPRAELEAMVGEYDNEKVLKDVVREIEEYLKGQF